MVLKLRGQMSKKTEIVIVGSLGLIGRALFKAFQKHYFIHTHDINKTSDGREITADPEKTQGLFMHVCIPYSEHFVKIVAEYHKAYNPKMIFVHSSVKPGTTSELVSAGIPAVHNPLMFDENNLYSTPYFRQMIGYDTDKYALLAESHLKKGFSTVLIAGSVNTEMSDIYLGFYHLTSKSILFEIAKIFTMTKTNYSIFNEMVHYYNLGYGSLNKPDNLMFNEVPKLVKEDFRISFFDFVPEEIISLFFKLAKKSFNIEQKYNKEQKEIADGKSEEIPKQGNVDQ